MYSSSEDHFIKPNLVNEKKNYFTMSVWSSIFRSLIEYSAVNIYRRTIQQIEKKLISFLNYCFCSNYSFVKNESVKHILELDFERFFLINRQSYASVTLMVRFVFKDIQFFFNLLYLSGSKKDKDKEKDTRNTFGTLKQRFTTIQ